jgi:hypothetical protein
MLGDGVGALHVGGGIKRLDKEKQCGHNLSTRRIDINYFGWSFHKQTKMIISKSKSESYYTFFLLNFLSNVFFFFLIYS